MRARIAQRARIARVRRVQHTQAAVVLAAAEAQVASLETSANRLQDLRGQLLSQRTTSAAALASAHELAGRLDTAHRGLVDSLAAARAAALRRYNERLDARRDQESAEKLEDRARAEAATLAERRQPAGRKRRSLEDLA